MEKEKEKKAHPAHVLVVPFPAQGHINPMLQFCKRLVSKGVVATLANSIYVSKSMHVDPTCPVGLETISDGFDDGGYGQAESPEAYLSEFQVVGSRTLANLIKKLNKSGRPVDVLIYDGFIPWALDVAKQFGLLGAVFFTQSGAVNSVYYHVYNGLLELPISGPIIPLPGLPDMEPWETPSFVHIYGSYPGFHDMVVNQFSNINDADWVLFNTFYELEKEVFDWIGKLWRVRTIGPTLPSKYMDRRLESDKDYAFNLFRPNSDTCTNWLNNKPNGSVAYVSFGSLANVGAEQMEETAWALKQSPLNFLWVVRESEQSKLPEKFIDETSEKGLIVTWSPQLEVLAHDAVGCFVTHCGFNSVLEAIGLGVPVVAVPQWTDQGTNAKYVEDVWATGLRARPDEKGVVRRGVLESCMREVMGGERGKEIKENAIKWKKLAKLAIDEGGSSDKNIDEFIAALMHS